MLNYGIPPEFRIIHTWLVSRDEFSRPVPRQPAHLHIQAESVAQSRDFSRVPYHTYLVYIITGVPHMVKMGRFLCFVEVVTVTHLKPLHVYREVLVFVQAELKNRKILVAIANRSRLG